MGCFVFFCDKPMADFFREEIVSGVELVYHRSRAFCSSTNIPEDLLLYKYIHTESIKYISNNIK